MTPHELRLLRGAGAVLGYNLPGYIVSWIMYGMSIVLIAYALVIFRLRGLKIRTSGPIFLATGVSGFMATLFFVSCVGAIAIYLELLLLPSKDPDILKQIDGPADRRSFFVVNVIQSWVASFVPILSDAIVIWRAWFLYPGQLWAMILPITLLLGSLATMMAANIPISSYPTWYEYVSTSDGILATLNQVSGWLSLATNATTTALVGYKFWMYRKHILPHVRVKGGMSSVGRTLGLMVESGVVFCVVQLAMTLTQIAYSHVPTVTTSLYIGTLALTNFEIALAAVYPVLVIVIIRSGNSATDTYNSLTLPTLVESPSRTVGQSQTVAESN